MREYYCDSIDSYRLATRSKTYDNIEVFSGVDLATTQVPADGGCGSNTASDLTHEQVGLVVDWSRQWYCARKPVLTVVSHLISVQSPRVVYDIDTASSLKTLSHCIYRESHAYEEKWPQWPCGALFSVYRNIVTCTKGFGTGCPLSVDRRYRHNFFCIRQLNVSPRSCQNPTYIGPPFLPKFYPKVTHPLSIWASDTFAGKLPPAKWLQIAQRSQWRACRKPPSLFRMVPSLTLQDLPFLQNVGPKCTPGPTSRRLQPPGEYDRRYRQAACCARCYCEPINVAFCQINAKNCRFNASVTMTLIKRRKRQKFVYCIFAC